MGAANAMVRMSGTLLLAGEVTTEMAITV